ncbi:replication protein RepA [Halomonas litopenaei]|nr:replication protein RepA [Halomonas litopenaei]
MTGRTYTHRVNTGGNFCGHRPENPRIALTEPVKQGKGGLPGVITEAMKRCVDYYNSPWKIPSLNLANGSTRQQRSERREACLSTLWAILKYTDLVTLKVGVPTPEGGFLNLTVKYLARWTGLKQRRVERALADLQAAGIVSVHPRCEKRSDGSYKGHAAIKAVNKLFFAIFGLQFRLGFERKRAAKRLKKKQQQHAKASGTKTSAARRNLTARAALDRAGSTIHKLGMGQKKSQPRQDDERSLAMDEELQRQLNELMFQYKMAHPDWTAQECREAAEKVIEARWR